MCLGDISIAKIDTNFEKLRFFSNFDNGNLSKVVYRKDNIYSVWMASDCEGRTPPLRKR